MLELPHSAASFFNFADALLRWGAVLYLGLVLGSFATALVYRIPKGLSWVYDRQLGSPRSACPSCRSVLGVRDLVPIVSWVLLKGRCRYCSVPIGPIYPMVEAICLVGCIGIFIMQGLTVSSGLTMLAVPFLAALAVIEIRHEMFAHALIPILAGLGGLRSLWDSFESSSTGLIWDSVAGGILFLAVAWGARAGLRVLLKEQVMSWPRARAFGMAGLWLGAGGFWSFTIPTVVLGGSIFVLCKNENGRRIFPHGAVIALVLYAVLTLHERP